MIKGLIAYNDPIHPFATILFIYPLSNPLSHNDKF